MSNGQNEGQVPTRIVELLIANISELSKQVQSMPNQVATDISPDLDKILVVTDTVLRKLNTPPRIEELDKKLDITLGKIDLKNVSDGVDGKIVFESIESVKKLIEVELIGKIKWMTLSVWIITSFVMIAMIIATLFIQVNNKDIVTDLKTALSAKAGDDIAENVAHKSLQKSIDDIRKIIPPGVSDPTALPGGAVKK